MHTPNPDEPRPEPQHDEDDVRQPPVPPDQEDDVDPIGSRRVPVRTDRR